MHQYSILIFVCIFLVVVFLVVWCLAFFRRKRLGKIKEAPEDIRRLYFSKLSCEHFPTVWREFCVAMEEINFIPYLDLPVSTMEALFPLSDMLYDNLEELDFISGQQDLENITIRQAFLLLYYNRFPNEKTSITSSI